MRPLLLQFQGPQPLYSADFRGLTAEGPVIRVDVRCTPFFVRFTPKSGRS